MPDKPRQVVEKTAVDLVGLQNGRMLVVSEMLSPRLRVCSRRLQEELGPAA
jgi:hypothetical protein